MRTTTDMTQSQLKRQTTISEHSNQKLDFVNDRVIVLIPQGLNGTSLGKTRYAVFWNLRQYLHFSQFDFDGKNTYT